MAKLRTLNDLKSKGANGKWQLDDHHILKYSSEEPELGDKRSKKEQVELEASLIAVEENSLIVSITEKQENGRIVTSLAQLTGVWRANEKNQLEFEVERQSDKNDVLTFKGSWTLNKNYELIYSYRRKSLKRKQFVVETLTFKGFWTISERNKLTYLMEGSSGTNFRFRGAFQTPSILAKKGEIRYQLGLETAGEKGRCRTLVFFGKWKLSNQLELEFELECEDGKKRALKFGAEFQLTDSLSVTAQLKTQCGDALGVEVILNKEFFQGKAQGFVRLRKSLEESAVEAGIAIPW